MDKAALYSVLASTLQNWEARGWAWLTAQMERAPEVQMTSVGGVPVVVEVSITWASADRTQLQITATGNGLSSWQLQRLEERLIVQMPVQAAI